MTAQQLRGGLAELGYTFGEPQNLKIKMQTLYWSNDWEQKDARDLTFAPVIEYQLNSSTTLRLGYFHDIYATGDNKNRQLLLQLYCFGL